MSLSLNDLLVRSNLVGDSLCIVDELDRPVFMGFAEAGTKPDEHKWKIIKFTYIGENTTYSSMRHADGSTDQNKVWDDKEEYTY
jgi:hypothetical protein